MQNILKHDATIFLSFLLYKGIKNVFSVPARFLFRVAPVFFIKKKLI